MSHYAFEPLEFVEQDEPRMLEAAKAFYRQASRRRTVREFSSRPVPREIIDYAIRAAGTAPSGANMQPWHFVAVSNAAIKRRIREGAEKEEREFYAHRASGEWLEALAPLGTDEHKPFLETAPWLIVVFLKKFTEDDTGRRMKNYYTAESVGIATGLLITALHLSGLVTLTHTPSPMKFLGRILGRDRNERPYLILVTGFPAPNATVPAIHRRPLDRIATYFD